MVVNDQYYRFNMVIDNIYFCPSNIVIKNGQIYEIGHPEEKILFDNFVLDIKNKTITSYNDKIKNSFLDAFENISKISVSKARNGSRLISIQKENHENPILILINKNNQLIGYKNEELTRNSVIIFYGAVQIL